MQRSYQGTKFPKSDKQQAGHLRMKKKKKTVNMYKVQFRESTGNLGTHIPNKRNTL